MWFTVRCDLDLDWFGSEGSKCRSACSRLLRSRPCYESGSSTAAVRLTAVECKKMWKVNKDEQRTLHVSTSKAMTKNFQRACCLRCFCDVLCFTRGWSGMSSEAMRQLSPVPRPVLCVVAVQTYHVLALLNFAQHCSTAYHCLQNLTDSYSILRPFLAWLTQEIAKAIVKWHNK